VEEEDDDEEEELEVFEVKRGSGFFLGLTDSKEATIVLFSEEEFEDVRIGF